MNFTCTATDKIEGLKRIIKAMQTFLWWKSKKDKNGDTLNPGFKNQT